MDNPVTQATRSIRHLKNTNRINKCSYEIKCARRASGITFIMLKLNTERYKYWSTRTQPKQLGVDPSGCEYTFPRQEQHIIYHCFTGTIAEIQNMHKFVSTQKS